MCERGELLRRHTEGSYETGVQCLYLLLDDAPSLPAGGVNVGRSQQARGDRGASWAAQGRDQPVLAALTLLLLLPSLCAMNQL